MFYFFYSCQFYGRLYYQAFVLQHTQDSRNHNNDLKSIFRDEKGLKVAEGGRYDELVSINKIKLNCIIWFMHNNIRYISTLHHVTG